MAERGTLFGEGPQACPFVALENDRARRSDEPDHRHRCYAEPTPVPRAIAHQRAYCLSPTFSGCPIFQDWAVRIGARPAPLRPQPAAESETPPEQGPLPTWAAPPPWSRAEPSPSEPEQMGAFDDDDDDDDDGGDGQGAAGGVGAAGDEDDPGRTQAIPRLPPLPPIQASADAPAGGRPTEPIERVPSLPIDRTGDAERDARLEEARRRRLEADRERRAEDERRRRADEERRERERAAAAAATVPPFLAGREVQDPATGRTPPQPPRGPQSEPPRPNADRPAQPMRQQARREDLVPVWEREPIQAYPTLRRRMSLRGSGDILGTLTTLFAILALLALVVFAVIAIPSLLGGGGSGPRPTGVPVAGSPSNAVTTTPSSAAPATATPVPAETPRTYTVRSGDTLFGIALEFGITVDQLLAANPQITDANLVQIGQVIVIPEPDDFPASPVAS